VDLNEKSHFYVLWFDVLVDFEDNTIMIKVLGF
jgi:hypothetical protein